MWAVAGDGGRFGVADGAAVAASRAAEVETGARHNRLMFWLHRRMTGTPAS